MEFNKIYNEPCLPGLEKLPDNSIDCCVTSPPYWGLRDYGVEGQLGLEETPKEYVDKMVLVFREVKRILKNEGTLWLNLGDSYAAGGRGFSSNKYKSKNSFNKDMGWRKPTQGLKPKDLVGIPWMVAFALRADGWYLRQDIIWHKPNPMPESVRDRCTKAHEYIFLLSKSKNYFFDSKSIKSKTIEPYKDEKRFLRQKEDNKSIPSKIKNGIRVNVPKGWDTKKGSHGIIHREGRSSDTIYNDKLYLKSNKRSVWTVSTQPFKEAHFATFPQKLIVDCIKAGCPENGIVLDPFMGAGTTAVVARKLNRNYIGFEINPEYVKICDDRMYDELGLYM